MKNFNKSKRGKTGLIADVDCTAAGKPLCEANGVQGFPTIKWGDPSNLEDYDGGRDYDSLKKFAPRISSPYVAPATWTCATTIRRRRLLRFKQCQLRNSVKRSRRSRRLLRMQRQISRKPWTSCRQHIRG